MECLVAEMWKDGDVKGRWSVTNDLTKWSIEQPIYGLLQRTVQDYHDNRQQRSRSNE